MREVECHVGQKFKMIQRDDICPGGCKSPMWETTHGEPGTPVPEELKQHLCHSLDLSWRYLRHRAKTPHVEYVYQTTLVCGPDFPEKFWSQEYKDELKRGEEIRAMYAAQAEKERQKAEADAEAKRKMDEIIDMLKKAHGEEVEMLKQMIRIICDKTGFPYPEGL